MPSRRADRTAARELALAHAVALYTSDWSGGPGADSSLRATATAIYAWLVGPAALFLTLGPVRDQQTGQPTGNNPKGSPMQLHDTEQVDLSVAVADVKGAPISDDSATTSDDLNWTVDDETVATLNVSGDTRTATVVAGTVGSTVITVSLGELSATLAVDVIPGAAAKVSISEGAPTEQNAG